jgi:hypothetical protein
LKNYANDKKTASRLCGSQVIVSGVGVTNMTLDDNKYIKISYSKSTGAFQYCNNGSAASETDGSFYSKIELKGTETFQVNLIKSTGKHYVE